MSNLIEVVVEGERVRTTTNPAAIAAILIKLAVDDYYKYSECGILLSECDCKNYTCYQNCHTKSLSPHYYKDTILINLLTGWKVTGVENFRITHLGNHYVYNNGWEKTDAIRVEECTDSIEVVEAGYCPIALAIDLPS